MTDQPSISRAALLVAAAALLEAALSPFLTLGWVAPRFAVVGIVVAVTGQRGLQALLLGFFGGVLTDALGGGLFGVGALGGLAAAAISTRLEAARRKRGEMRVALAISAALAVVAYDIVGLLAPLLAGQGGPAVGTYLVAGVLPDALLNALLAFVVGVWLVEAITRKEGGSQV